jgi:protein phosphatase 1 regulatory subunit 7
LHPNSGDSDCDEGEKDEGLEEDDGDLLADLPDETEVHLTVNLSFGEFLIGTDKELDLVHSRLSSLDRFRLPRFAAHLQRLCLRQNFISALDPKIFSALTKLVELDLYDNKIKTIGDALSNLTALT